MIRRFVLFWLLAGVLIGTPVLLYAQANPEGESPSDLTIHVVQRGETLFRIALRYETSVDELVELNGLSDPTRIIVGQRLLVPAELATAPQPQTHIVQPGETLMAIAQTYGIDMATLIEQNEIVNANAIYPGQELTIIPTGDDEAEVAATPVPSSPTEVAASDDSGILPTPESATIANASEALAPGNLHVVQSGETLFRIATRYNLTTQELARANNISDPTVIYVGQTLIIPGLPEAPTVELDLPEGVTALDVQPLIFVEGETGVIRLSTIAGVSVSGGFGDRELTVISDDSRSTHTMLVGIPMFAAAGVFPVALTLTMPDGTQSNLTFNVRVATGLYGTQNLNVAAQELTAPAVQDAEFELLQRITRNATQPRRWQGPLSIPAAAAMNSPFGTRRSYNGGPVNTYHSGADFASAPGTPILAAGDGTVVLADALNIRGNTVVIDHGWGVYTLYAHQTTINVAVGQQVTSGQMIGTAGSTGRVTGPHLHWEVWVNGVPVNPLTWTQRDFSR